MTEDQSNWHFTFAKRWYAADEIAREAQEVYDFRTRVGDPYAMHKTLECVINRLKASPGD